MVAGIGIDIVEVEKFGKALNRWGNRLLKKIFTPQEIAFCERRKNRVLSYSVRFAAKEAVSKALGTGIRRGVYWKDIEVLDDERSKPTVKLRGLPQKIVGNQKLLLSLSHNDRQSVAIVIII